MQENTSPDKERWLKLFNGIDFFKGFTQAELEELLNCGEVKKYYHTEYILKEKQEERMFYVILKGNVSIIKVDPQKQKRSIAMLHQGECFGEMALFLDHKRTASAMASQECFLYIISESAIDRMELLTQRNLYRQISFALSLKLKNFTEYFVTALSVYDTYGKLPNR